jgi:ABC-2 type transport system permease protein
LYLKNEIIKDATQFMRERRTLLLLFAAPIIVLLILGGVFGRTSAEIGGTTIGYCDMDQKEISQLFISGIQNNTKIIDYSNNTQCNLFVEREVQQGRLTAAFVIPEGFQKGIESGISQNITIYLDNSKIQTAPSIEAFMKAAVQETGQQIGARFIQNVWTKLDDAQMKLVDLLDDINQTRDDAIFMKSRLENTSISLNSINFTLMNNEIAAANSTIDMALKSMDSAESNLSEIQSNFDSYENELNQTQADLEVINNTLANATSFIIYAKSVANCTNPIFLPYCLSLDSLNSTVASAQSSVESRLIKVKSARTDLKEANQTIQDFKLNIQDAKLGANNSIKRIENMSRLVHELEQNRASALATINDVVGSLDELVNKTYELESIILDSSGQIKEITSRKPESVISPILLSPNNLFGTRTFFDFLLPSLLPLILMFVSLFLSSTTLVREKNNGTLSRILLSQVNSLEYAATKVFSYSAVLLPLVVLLTIITSFVYQAFTVFDLGTALFIFETLVLLLLAFNAIGIVIAIYSESEATAFLASLVIGLPLLFLSGILFPFEFMPTSIALLGLASPLTQAVLSMQSVILYQSPQAIGFGILFLYAIVFTLIAAFSLRRAKLS